MSLQPIKTALKHLAAWSLVVAFIALLTVIFSFLGSLFCAALGGMMMGATRVSRLLSIFFSLLCPGVLLGVMRAQQTELLPRQILVLMGICLAVFWAIYFVSAAVMAQEQRASLSQSVPPPGSLELQQENRAESVSATERSLRESLTRAANDTEPWPEALEGQWSREICGPDGRIEKRILEIKEGALQVSTLDAQGRVCCSTRGRLDCAGGPRALRISGLAEEAFPSPAI